MPDFSIKPEAAAKSANVSKHVSDIRVGQRLSDLGELRVLSREGQIEQR